MAYNNNSWEGFDGSQIVYDDAKKRNTNVPSGWYLL